MERTGYSRRHKPPAQVAQNGESLRHAFLELLDGGPDRVSSIWPQRVALCLATLSVLAFVCAWLNFQVRGPRGHAHLQQTDHHSLVMAGIGIIDGLAAVVAGTLWKSVRVGRSGLTISDLFRSEEVSFGDVCLLVPSRGLFGNVMRVHFRRPTRFGWGVGYVPRE